MGFGIVQRVFSEKASAIARMRQKCVRIASEMRSRNAAQAQANSAATPPLGWARGFRLDPADPSLLSRWACWGKPSPGVWLAPAGGGLALSAGADFARRLSVPGAASSNGRMDASEQATQYPTTMDGRSGATRTPRRDGLDAQPPFCPVPGIEGQRQRQRTGQTQTQGSLPGSISPSHYHSGLLRGSRQATTQPQTQRGAGHPDFDRDQMSEMPGIQLDQQRAVQIMRDTPSQAAGYLHQLYSTIAAGGQASRHYARQILCGCRRRLTPRKPVCAGLGQGGSLQTPGGIGDCDRNLAGRIPSEDGTFHSVGLRQGEAQGPKAAGSQARLGNRWFEEGHRQAGKGRRSPTSRCRRPWNKPASRRPGPPKNWRMPKLQQSTSVNLRKVGACAWIMADRLQRTGLENPTLQQDPRWMFSSVCMVCDRFERPSGLPHKTSLEEAYGKDSRTLAHFFASRPSFPCLCMSLSVCDRLFLRFS